jgi:hypothetical protein
LNEAAERRLNFGRLRREVGFAGKFTLCFVRGFCSDGDDPDAFGRFGSSHININ